MTTKILYSRTNDDVKELWRKGVDFLSKAGLSYNAKNVEHLKQYGYTHVELNNVFTKTKVVIEL